MTLAMLICQCARTQWNAHKMPMLWFSHIHFCHYNYVQWCDCIGTVIVPTKAAALAAMAAVCGNNVSKESHIYKNLFVTIYELAWPFTGAHFNDLYASKHEHSSAIIIIITLNIKLSIYVIKWEKKTMENSANATKFAVKCSNVKFMSRLIFRFHCTHVVNHFESIR